MGVSATYKQTPYSCIVISVAKDITMVTDLSTTREGEPSKSVKRRIELQRSVVQGLKANLETTENKLVIAMEKQLDFFLEKLTRCPLDGKEMNMLKSIGELLIQIRKLTISDDKDAVTVNVSANIDEMRKLAGGG